ncbi:TauD/TfdA family dioxygenase, partial [Rhodococcus sp. CX]|uniref:TauD/TfdA family dioxygenase n=2 Tax=unclassified Rhodococcus (in: high G+C Gram-positive bacteria) TaxID=192944 RepID=UPI001E28E867
MTTTLPPAGDTRTAFRVERLTATIGAELSGVYLGDVARDETLFAQLRALLLEHKVLFFRDQDIT